MGVPAHDQRDFEFAEKYGLPKKVVIEPPDWNGKELSEAYVGTGKQINSGDFNGKRNEDAWNSIADYIEINDWGRRTVNYRMRDWLISRQRYWGTPIPVTYCDGCGIVPVPEAELPVLLPKNAEFKPTGESPLKYHKEFYLTVNTDDATVDYLQDGTGEHNANITITGSQPTTLNLTQHSNTTQNYTLSQNCVTSGGCSITVTQN